MMLVFCGTALVATPPAKATVMVHGPFTKVLVEDWKHLPAFPPVTPTSEKVIDAAFTPLVGVPESVIVAQTLFPPVHASWFQELLPLLSFCQVSPARLFMMLLIVGATVSAAWTTTVRCTCEAAAYAPLPAWFALST